MKKYIFIFILLIPIQGYCQNISDQVINAFSTSYASESVKDYDKAIKDIKQVYSDKSYEINLRLGWLYYEDKNYDQSILYYKQAIKLKPSSVEAMLGYAYPASAIQKWDELFAMYQKALTIDPNNATVNYRLALMFYYKKEFGNAEKQLARNLEHFPFDYDNTLLMAQVKLAMGKISDSKHYYQKALLYNPSNDEIKKVLSKL